MSAPTTIVYGQRGKEESGRGVYSGRASKQNLTLRFIDDSKVKARDIEVGG